MKKAVLTAEDIRFQYNSDFVLDVPRIELFPGEITGMIGPNGSGKSTLIKVLSFLEKTEQGRIAVEGANITEGSNSLALRRGLAVVFQDPLLFSRSVWENVAAPLKFRKEPNTKIREKVDYWLSKLQIKHLADRSARNISGGEAQRVSLARALVTEPKVFFMDEPFANLDQPTKENLMHQLRGVIAESKVAVLFVTQDREEAAVFSDTLGVMRAGRIVQMGTPVEIFTRPASAFIAGFVGVENIFPARSDPAFNDKNIDLGPVKITAPTDKTGEVHISIRPEDILLSSQKVESSARNVFQGRITRIQPKERTFYITVDIGVPLVCLVTKLSKEELALDENKDIWVLFKATSVHVI